MQWERCEISTRRHGGTAKKDLIWLTKNSGSPNAPYSKLNISGNLIKEAGWKSDDSIWLYKSGNTFLIRKEPSDFYLKRPNNNSESRALVLASRNFVAQILASQILNDEMSCEFDAHVTDEGIVFTARKE